MGVGGAGGQRRRRGGVSTDAAAPWEEGLLLGNGTVGANVFGRPLDETIVLRGCFGEVLRGT